MLKLHKKVNKKTIEYWLDMEDWPDKIIPIKIPYKYIIEMFCDMYGASKAYNQEKWEPKMLWDYWNTKCKGKRLMHKESEYFLEKLILKLNEFGEEKFIHWYKDSKKYLKDAYSNGTLCESKDSK